MNTLIAALLMTLSIPTHAAVKDRCEYIGTPTPGVHQTCNRDSDALRTRQPRAPDRNRTEAAHNDHAKHNMLIFGEQQIFADHIVFKAPHNIQVILRLELDEEARSAYLAARQEHPDSIIKLLLDQMVIQDIASYESISGVLLYENEAGEDQVILPKVVLTRAQFKVLFINELPISLESGHQH